MNGSCSRTGNVKHDCNNSTIGGVTTLQATVTESFEASRKFSPTSPQAVELNKSVAYYLAKDVQPFYTVERPGFLALVLKLNPCYEPPERKYFVEHHLVLSSEGKGCHPYTSECKVLFSNN